MVTRRGPLAACLLAGLLGAAPLAAQGTPAKAPAPAPAGQPATAEHHHHMDMPAVTIPKGVIWTEADVRFMQGMIAHHAQAIYMSRLATGRGAHERLQKLAKKIDMSQAGEIALMQDWLRANKQFVPDTSAWRTMTMPGMLTAEEMAGLEKANGAEFDRSYLELMIRHHEGALRMVADLLDTPRAAQDVDVSVFANDVVTVQTAEIGLMHVMLADM